MNYAINAQNPADAEELNGLRKILDEIKYNKDCLLGLEVRTETINKSLSDPFINDSTVSPKLTTTEPNGLLDQIFAVIEKQKESITRLDDEIYKIHRVLGI